MTYKINYSGWASYLPCGSKPALFSLIFSYPTNKISIDRLCKRRLWKYVLRLAKPSFLRLKLSSGLGHGAMVEQTTFETRVWDISNVSNTVPNGSRMRLIGSRTSSQHVRGKIKTHIRDHTHNWSLSKILYSRFEVYSVACQQIWVKRKLLRKLLLFFWLRKCVPLSCSSGGEHHSILILQNSLQLLWLLIWCSIIYSEHLA